MVGVHNIEKNVILIWSFFCFLNLSAQTVVWQMQPSDYDEIVRVNENLYKVVRNGKIGLINSDGTIVAPVENDAVSFYYEHKALLTYTDGHGECISGCLTDGGCYYRFLEKYYTLNGQKFFSDGLLSVADENGKLGYIDCFGNAVLGFNGKYNRIKPFSEGYAAVREKTKNKYILIDKEEKAVKFVYGGNGFGPSVEGCTNVYNGQSYVHDEYGDFYVYDARTNGRLKKVSKIKKTTLDYLFCYSSVTGRTMQVPFVENIQEGTKGLNASSLENLFGYVQENNVVLPYQLTAASQFEDGYAIVNKNGRWGILKYIEGDSFHVSVPQKTYNFYSGMSVTCSFSLFVPAVWRDKGLEVVLKDADTTIKSFGQDSGNYEFNVTPASTSQKAYTVVVYAEGLRLYETVLTYSFVKKERW